MKSLRCLVRLFTAKDENSGNYELVTWFYRNIQFIGEISTEILTENFNESKINKKALKL